MRLIFLEYASWFCFFLHFRNSSSINLLVKWPCLCISNSIRSFDSRLHTANGCANENSTVTSSYAAILWCCVAHMKCRSNKAKMQANRMAFLYTRDSTLATLDGGTNRFSDAEILFCWVIRLSSACMTSELMFCCRHWQPQRLERAFCLWRFKLAKW